MTMEAEVNWRACSVCQGLINFNIGQRSCFNNGIHEFSSSADYRAVRSTFPDGVQRGWGACTQCSRLVCRFVAPGVCADGVSQHQFDEFGVEYGVPFQAMAEPTQPGWRWCRLCQCLCDETNPSRACFASGGGHDFSASAAYEVPVVPFALQDWWQWCSKCQSVVFGGPGVCSDGAEHQVGGGGVTYALPYGVAPPGAQPGWKRCTKCAILAFSEISGGNCFAGGEHAFSSPLNYAIYLGDVPDHAQPGWRWCSTCQSMGFTDFGAGPCPAGGTHDHAISAPYSLYPSSLADGQPGWRACQACSSMVFTGLTGGSCRNGGASGAHDLTGSGSYLIPLGQPPINGESSWRICARCQTLVSDRDGDGICVDGAIHDLVDSPLYGLPIEFFPEGAQPTWRRCNRCHQLFFTGAGVLDSRCADDGPHDPTGSAEYMIPFAPIGPHTPPPPPARHLTIAEDGQKIVVDGAGFSAGASIDLSYIMGSKTIKATISVDAAGAFEHVATPVIAAAAGGLVLAREQGATATSGRLKTSFPVG